MSLEMNFKVLEEVPAPDPGLDQEVVAREITTGRPVVIHFLREKPGPEHNAFLRQLLRLGPNENSYVLESGTFGGRAYIVTKILPENVSLRAWAERFQAGAPAAGQAPDAVASPVSASADTKPAALAKPGEFTQLFQTASAPSVTEQVAPRPAAAKPGEFTQLFQAATAPPVAEQVTSPPAAVKPGEFTQLFQTASALPKPEQVAPPPAAAKPGQFTQLFQTASAPLKPEQVVTSPAAAKPGEFTQMFQSPIAPQPTERYARPAAAVKPAETAVPQTKAFFDGLAKPAPGAAAPREGGQGEATMMFSPVAPRSQVTAEGPVDDEFARKFGNPVSRPADVKPPAIPKPGVAEAAQKAAVASTSYAPLIIVLAGLILAALLLVAFFAVRG